MRRMGLLALLFFMLPLLRPEGEARAVEISGVRHEPAAGFDPLQGGAAIVHFRLSEPARAEVRVYDGRDRLVRTLVPGSGPAEPSEPNEPTELAAGQHRIEWDGRDSRGRPVPPEAYRYTIHATARGAEPVEWDISDQTEGERLRPDGVNWDPESGRIHYTLTRPARVRIRVGLRGNGPMLRTVVGWVARPSGANEEAWDGFDASHVLDLRQHPKLLVDVRAYSLSKNTLLVGPPSAQVHLIPDLPADTPVREKKQRYAKRMYDYARQQIEHRRDIPLSLVLPDELAEDSAGLPIVTQPTPVRLQVSDADRALLVNQRFEAVFYVDGVYVFETEVGFFPMTWKWDVRAVPDGEHYVTVNLRGYEGHFGLATRKVRVQKVHDQKASASRDQPVDTRQPTPAASETR